MLKELKNHTANSLIQSLFNSEALAYFMGTTQKSRKELRGATRKAFKTYSLSNLHTIQKDLIRLLF